MSDFSEQTIIDEKGLKILALAFDELFIDIQPFGSKVKPSHNYTYEVNQSLLFWAILEYLVFGKSLRNFVFAKFITLLTFCLSVPILFYAYVAILG